MARTPDETRSLILKAAGSLFANEGIRTTSVEAIAARAGVTKRTLYVYFRSKDDLIATYLAMLDVATRARYEAWLSGDDAIETRIFRMFDRLAAWASDPRWKGCGFTRAATELAGLPGHPGVTAAKAHKKAFEAWLDDEFAQEGLAGRTSLARRVMVILDGAIAQALIHHDPAYIREAGALASEIVSDARMTAVPLTAPVNGRMARLAGRQ